MTISQRLVDIAALMEERLSTHIRRKIETGEPGCGVSERLSAAMRHGALEGGKRFRPLLVVECARLFGVAQEAAVEAAAAVECVHCYSLIHDDLPSMDNDALRRGRPTVWKAFNDWTAILAGDALLSLAFEILAEETVHPDPTVRIELVRLLAVASGGAGMVGGQALDLEADKLSLPASPSAEHVRVLQGLKTGALIACACEFGAVLGRAGAADRANVVRFGAALGRAFQIADDLLDHEGDVETVGKAVTKDAAAGKATLLSLVGVDAARGELQQAEDDAIAALQNFGAAGDVLREAAFFVSRRSN